MLIALDYDETYTADPELWLTFVIYARSRGHKVVLATMRYPTEDDLDPKLVKELDQVVFTSRQTKRPFLQQLGLEPAIWIDDHPEWIVDTSIIVV